MIIRTILAASTLYFLLYPRYSTWWIENCKILSMNFYFSFSKGFLFDVNIQSNVVVFNPNLIGSRVYIANYELFYLSSTYDIRRLGTTKISLMDVPSRKYRQFQSYGKIEELGIVSTLSLLNELWVNNGRLQIVALGSAKIKPVVFGREVGPNFLIAIRCYEDIIVNLFDSRLAQLSSNTSKGCQFSYDFFKNMSTSDELPFLNRKYIYKSF